MRSGNFTDEFKLDAVAQITTRKGSSHGWLRPGPYSSASL